jgi:predicted nucleic acid-binding protein
VDDEFSTAMTARVYGLIIVSTDFQLVRGIRKKHWACEMAGPY